MKITRKNAPAPLILDPDGNQARRDIMPGQLKSVLDRAFSGHASESARRPGRLTALIDELPDKHKQSIPMSPRLGIAALTSRFVQQIDCSTERAAVEIGILAQWDGHFHFNRHPMIAANGWETTDAQADELDKRTVDICLSRGFIRPGDTVMDVGAGMGFFAKHLAAQGLEVEVLEPFLNEVPGFPRAHRLTARQFLQAHPDRRFSVVYAGNFSPLTRRGFIDLDLALSLLADLKDMTADDGHLLLGISSMDPQFVSGTSRYRLRPHLEEKFEKVEYFSPRKIDQGLLSIGGQMGLFKCAVPRRAEEKS